MPPAPVFARLCRHAVTCVSRRASLTLWTKFGSQVRPGLLQPWDSLQSCISKTWNRFNMCVFSLVRNGANGPHTKVPRTKVVNNVRVPRSVEPLCSGSTGWLRPGGEAVPYTHHVGAWTRSPQRQVEGDHAACVFSAFPRSSRSCSRRCIPLPPLRAPLCARMATRRRSRAGRLSVMRTSGTPGSKSPLREMAI